MAFSQFFTRMLDNVGDRDGRARALEPFVPQPMLDSAAPAPAADAGSDQRIPPPPQPVTEALAAKLLGSWLENRRQTLIPHTLNFGVLRPEQARLLLQLMAVAAQADGQVDQNEERQIPLALERFGAGEAHSQELRRALAEPPALGPLLAEVQVAGLSSHGYAAALLAVNRTTRVNQLFLDYLAARLGLLPDVATSLQSRYRA